MKSTAASDARLGRSAVPPRAARRRRGSGAGGGGFVKLVSFIAGAVHSTFKRRASEVETIVDTRH
eukprot:976960-Pleurochrysis_carterae.AAC.1